MTLDVLMNICPAAEEWELMRELGLLAAQLTMVFVEHDAAFREKIAARHIVL